MGNIATKDQELKALQQIRKIVEGLGEGSYLSITFEGCFDLAEENIENDWGCSMASRARSAESKAEKAETEVESLKCTLKAATDLVESMEKKTLGRSDLVIIEEVFRVYDERLENDIKAAASDIVERAEEPSSNGFREAVERHRWTVTREAQVEAAYSRVIGILNSTK